jgi:hypothetical protein
MCSSPTAVSSLAVGVHCVMSLPLSQDNEHNLIMKPGDMVLYESAKLLHGRPGKFFEMCTTIMCGVSRCFVNPEIR